MIWRRRLKAPTSFNEELSEIILQRAQREPSHPSWNRGGWRSKDDLHTWNAPAVAALHAFVQAAFDEVSGEDHSGARWVAWAIVNRRGTHHLRHVHNGKWTGIYYVTTSTGDTVFEVPSGIERITPDAGLLVVAPSNVYHFVEPCLDDAPRITIAFEAR